MKEIPLNEKQNFRKFDLEVKNKHNSIIQETNLEGYNSSDDIENQQLIRITNLSISDESDKTSEDIKINKKKLDKIDKEDFLKNLFRYRIMNSISILVILITFFCISFSKLNNPNYFLIMEHLGNHKIQSESNLLILNMAFCIVTGKNFILFLF